MALLNYTTFKLTNPPTIKTYSEEFLAQFADVWQYQQDNQDEGITIDFGTSEAREKWLKDAKTYGASQGEPLTIRRVSNTDSANPEHGIASFVIEKTGDKAERLAERKAKAEIFAKMRTWLNANGENLPERGRISKEMQDKYTKAHPNG